MEADAVLFFFFLAAPEPEGALLRGWGLATPSGYGAVSLGSPGGTYHVQKPTQSLGSSL